MALRTKRDPGHNGLVRRDGHIWRALTASWASIVILVGLVAWPSSADAQPSSFFSPVPATLWGASLGPGLSAAPGTVGRPLMVVAGASFTAGVGASAPDKSWAYLLASKLGWRLEVRAVPGAGYVRPGRHDGGPIARLLEEADLSRSQPSLVIIQAGHNDIGEPLQVIAKHVSYDIRFVERQAPQARIALITVFVRGNTPSHAALATERVIVSAARAADPSVLIMDPLQPRWRFMRAPDHLHPTDAGDLWIAHKVATILVSSGFATEFVG